MDTTPEPTKSSAIASFLHETEMGPGRNLNKSVRWTQLNGWSEWRERFLEMWRADNEGSPWESIMALVDTSLDQDEWNAAGKASLPDDNDTNGNSTDEYESGDEERDRDDDKGKRSSKVREQEKKKKQKQKEDQKQGKNRRQETTKKRDRDDPEILDMKTITAARLALFDFSKKLQCLPQQLYFKYQGVNYEKPVGICLMQDKSRLILIMLSPYSLYRVIRDPACKGYARSFIAVLALLLRFRRADSALQKCISIKITPAQGEARDALDDYLQNLSSNGSGLRVRSNTFDGLLFQLFVTLLEEEIPLERKLDTPMELARLFSNLMDDGGVKDASTSTQTLAANQYMLRTIGIQTGRLAFEGKRTYEPWSSKDNFVGGEVTQVLTDSNELKLHE